MLQTALAILASIALIALPLAMIWSMIAHFRTPPSRRPSGGSTSAAVGAALQELDRLMARASAEHTIEAKQQLPRRDDQSDD
jgi:hypothetical protein